MLRLCLPNLYLECILQLELPYLRQHGLEGLLLDIDGTLKDFRKAEVGLEVSNWLRTMRDAGIRLCLLSNGKPHRIGPLAQSLGLPLVALAGKPLPFGCRRALRMLDMPAGRAAMVGDQVFADVLAGRLSGLHTILVRPSSLDEPWFTRVKRPFERRWLRWATGRIPHLQPSENHPLASLANNE